MPFFSITGDLILDIFEALRRSEGTRTRQPRTFGELQVHREKTLKIVIVRGGYFDDFRYGYQQITGRVEKARKRLRKKVWVLEQLMERRKVSVLERQVEDDSIEMDVTGRLVDLLKRTKLMIS